VAHPKQDAPSIVDVLLGRQFPAALMNVSPQQRVYHNHRMHDPSLRAEIANAGRRRNQAEETANPVAGEVREILPKPR
jgi:hypothetical protein